MEAWRLMLELSVVLVIYAVVVTTVGESPSVPGFLVVAVLGFLGLLAGRYVTEEWLNGSE